jgi:hypothetical protein
MDPVGFLLPAVHEGGARWRRPPRASGRRFGPPPVPSVGRMHALRIVPVTHREELPWGSPGLRALRGPAFQTRRHACCLSGPRERVIDARSVRNGQAAGSCVPFRARSRETTRIASCLDSTMYEALRSDHYASVGPVALHRRIALDLGGPMKGRTVIAGVFLASNTARSSLAAYRKNDHGAPRGGGLSLRRPPEDVASEGARRLARRAPS